MFRFTERLSSGKSGPQESRRYLKRAGLFAAGLALLWVALQLVPSSEAPEGPQVYADDSGAVASNRPVTPRRSGSGMFGLGNVAALLLLGGGGAFAFYLHKRAKSGPASTSAIESIGELVIGQNQQLRLVKCGEEVLLLGVTSGQINLLRTYEGDAFTSFEEVGAVEEARRYPAAPAFQSSAFADVLRQYAGRYATPTSR